MADLGLADGEMKSPRNSFCKKLPVQPGDAAIFLQRPFMMPVGTQGIFEKLSSKSNNKIYDITWLEGPLSTCPIQGEW